MKRATPETAEVRCIDVRTAGPFNQGLSCSISSLHVMDATAPLSVTGLPGLSMRFGTSKDGLPIGVQLVSPWLAESTILHLGSLLESLSPVRDLHPSLANMGVLS